VVPKHEAQALLAYLLSLKQSPLPMAETTGDMGGSAGPATPATPAASNKEANAPAAATQGSAKGKQLFSANCSACHQETGEGLPGAFPALKGNAAVNDANPATHIHVVLFGLAGATIDGTKYESEMPEFGSTLSDADIADIVNYERSSWGNHGKPVTAQDVTAERAKGK
jgi:cytochrome c oxidase cbb3-type subunit 2